MGVSANSGSTNRATAAVNRAGVSGDLSVRELNELRGLRSERGEPSPHLPVGCHRSTSEVGGG